MARLLTRVASLGKKRRQFRGQQGLDWVYSLKTKRRVSMGWPLDFWFEEVNEKTRYTGHTDFRLTVRYPDGIVE